MGRSGVDQLAKDFTSEAWFIHVRCGWRRRGDRCGRDQEASGYSFRRGRAFSTEARGHWQDSFSLGAVIMPATCSKQRATALICLAYGGFWVAFRSIFEHCGERATYENTQTAFHCAYYGGRPAGTHSS